MKNQIVIIDDDLDLLNSFKLVLLTNGFANLKLFSNSLEALSYIEKNEISIVLIDINMPELNGIELLKKIKSINPLIEAIMITAVNETNIIVEAMKNGAFDYLVKPINELKLISTVKNALGSNELKNENENLNTIFLNEGLKHPGLYEQIITKDSKMIKIFKYIDAIATTNQPVLITGETGTGKELIANAIHQASNRFGEYITVNVAGIDDKLFSEKLFGYIEGAFEGAKKSKRGLIEKATEGTLFIDEIGDLHPESQIKLLRLLQEKEYYPIGSDTPKPLNTRIIVATNRNLKELLKIDKFRNDLYYRLKTHQIILPPIRERKNDIKLLLEYFLVKACKKRGIHKLKYGKKFIDMLQSYDYPGNIRELKSIIFDIVSNSEGEEINIQYTKSMININMDKNTIHKTNDPNYFNFSEENFPTLKEVTDNLVMKALKRSAGNQSLASRLLGVTRQALNQRLKKYPYLLNEFSKKKDKIIQKKIKKNAK